MAGQLADQRAGRDIPDLHDPINTPRRQVPAVRPERHGANRKPIMSVDRAEEPARLDLPDPQDPRCAPGSQEQTVGAETDAERGLLVSREATDFLAVGRAPKDQAAVVATRGKVPAV